MISFNQVGTFQGNRVPTPIPSEVARLFYPATHYVYEWSDYWPKYPDSDRIRVGSRWIDPVADDLFRLRFENQLGLADVQPFHADRPLCLPLWLEVISPKFPTLDDHLTFFRCLLTDLSARAARLPFTFTAETRRGVTETVLPPTPLFTFHFLREHAVALHTALDMVQAAPHRRLAENPRLVPIGEAGEADADVLFSILQSPENWMPTSGSPLSDRLKGYSPTHVWQRCPEEGFDTPENRFVLAFLTQLVAASGSLAGEAWWQKIPEEKRRLVREVQYHLEQAIRWPMFEDVGAMRHLPSASRVLQRREGYRDLLGLWSVFQSARQPLFGTIQEAIDLRDVATLYEMWCFFALVEEVCRIYCTEPVLKVRLSDEHGLGWKTTASFEDTGTLIYNQRFGSGGTFRSYSVPLRPDIVWVQAGQAVVALDAKFRRDQGFLGGADDGTAKDEDIHKMHAYRDALRLRAAVCLYPGNVAVFYDQCGGSPQSRWELRDLLCGSLCGVGALPMRPHVDGALEGEDNGMGEGTGRTEA